MPAPSARMPRGIALYATILCLLTVAAAVISFANGSWVGLVWVALAGLTSNMAWYYLRRSRRSSAPAPSSAGGSD